MSRFKKIAIIAAAVELLLIFFCNILWLYGERDAGQRLYRVEAERAAERLRESGGGTIDLSEFSTIVAVSEFHGEECNNDYVVEEVNGTLYRIEYRADRGHKSLLYVNAALLWMVALTAFVFWYVSKKILAPFAKMQDMPAELARGNLVVPLREEKDKYFGKFLWGMDMLRENLEERKERELELQKERKTLILSLSHDIKTPLSAIELYARALAEDLYDSSEKRSEVLGGIEKNVREIKRYMDEITTASREDFLNMEVKEGEVYLSDVISFIENYYRDKLSVLHTEFAVEDETDCLLKGDKDRLVEVLQNMMENAVKYGDGRRITISFDEDEDCKLVTVENTGETPDADEIPYLFDSFYRGSNHKNIKGSGLGLYICKNLMRKMDGDVFAEVGEGTFRVTAVIRRV